MSDSEISQRDEATIAAVPAAAPRRAVALRRWLAPAAMALGVLAAMAGAYYAGRFSAAGNAPVAQAAVTPAPGGAKDKVGSGKTRSGQAGSGKANKGKPAGAKAAKVEQRAPLYLALEPAFVVNFQDSENLRFLQVEVQVMAYEQSDLDALAASDPMVRNALVMLFGDQAYETLATREGKERLREQALAELRRILRDRAGKDGLEAVYFTSFVMQ